MLKNSFKNVNILGKSLDASWLKHKAISNNIANINTPGYKREYVNFDNVLKNEIDKNAFDLTVTDDKHFDINNNISDPMIKREMNYSFRRDENNVNIDIESAELAKNTIKYQALVKQMNSQLKRLRMAIENGGKA
jgi:flagellar basal-body rod protein FlgB